jgi:hypothetical protein
MILNSKDLQKYTSRLFEEYLEKSEVLTAKTVSESDDIKFINVKSSIPLDTQEFYKNGGNVAKDIVNNLFHDHCVKIKSLYDEDKHYGILFGITTESVVGFLIKGMSFAEDKHFTSYIAADNGLNPPFIALYTVSRIRYLERNMATKESREKAAQAWCKESTKHLVMIPELAEEFAKILDEQKTENTNERQSKI